MVMPKSSSSTQLPTGTQYSRRSAVPNCNLPLQSPPSPPPLPTLGVAGNVVDLGHGHGNSFPLCRRTGDEDRGIGLGQLFRSPIADGGLHSRKTAILGALGLSQSAPPSLSSTSFLVLQVLVLQVLRGVSVDTTAAEGQGSFICPYAECPSLPQRRRKHAARQKHTQNSLLSFGLLSGQRKPYAMDHARFSLFHLHIDSAVSTGYVRCPREWAEERLGTLCCI